MSAPPADGRRAPVPEGPYVVAGLGRAGTAAVQTLADLGGDVIACDHSKASPIRRERRRLRRAGIVTLLGHDPPVFDRTPAPRCLVKSPGIPLDAPLLASARRRGVAVIDELELGWRLSEAQVVGVTGTNGKSTVAGLVTALLAADGRRARLAGNAEYGRPLSEVAREPSDWIVCEASSFQLEACDSLLPDIAVFTNLSADHIARHGSMSAYGAAKRRLFIRGDAVAPVSVIDVDCAFGHRLARDVEDAGGRVIRVGRAEAADYRVERARWDLRRAELSLATPAGGLRLRTPLPGRYNARNVAAAIAVADAAGVARDRAIATVASHTGPPGRFDRIDEGQDFDVIVDYATTPAGIAQFLRAVRDGMSKRGRLRAVLCALGRADAPLRRDSARLAALLSDELAVTPTRLHGGSRLDQMALLVDGAAEAPGANVAAIPERRTAIEQMVRTARAGDAVVLLGRGATSGPAVDGGGRSSPRVSDADVARDALRHARR